MINCLWHTNHDSKSVPKRCLLLFIDLCFMNFIACNNRACNNWCGWFQEHSPLQVPPGMESPVASPSDAPGVWYYDRVRWQKARTFPVCFCMFLLLALVSGWCWWCSCNFNDELIKHPFRQVDSQCDNLIRPVNSRFTKVSEVLKIMSEIYCRTPWLNWLSSKCTMK